MWDSERTLHFIYTRDPTPKVFKSSVVYTVTSHVLICNADYKDKTECCFISKLS